ncbi:hypothetical protein FEM48_Zijuj07G0046800 [Ziziphus jujuba var. spinosa]|uniref:3'-5' exonuclease domain-containing protein n=1 Tax=Ziziphus jujuba var. spinosa TaxID=714518 RepID=A0A978V2I1_ZIZJJ|nr:hypothetical protein FEM48_Zijuj07G0046800 [Ziziphus jujuba var. spinosa]
MEEFHKIDFCGTKILTTVTCSAKAVDEWISTISDIHRERMSNLILGLDIKWLPCFKPNEPNPVAIIQICVGHRCLIFQILYADSIPESLLMFLATPEFTFVGVGIKEYTDKLFDDWGLKVGNTMDLAHAAAEKYGVSDYKRKGLKKLAMELMGKRMQKPVHVTLSEWDAKKLSLEQVEYACTEAYVSFKLGMLLKNEHNDSTVNDPIMDNNGPTMQHHFDPYDNYGYQYDYDDIFDQSYDDPYNYGNLDQRYDDNYQWYDDLYHYGDAMLGNPYVDLINDRYNYDASIIDQYFDGPYNYGDLIMDYYGDPVIDHYHDAIVEPLTLYVLF